MIGPRTCSPLFSSEVKMAFPSSLSKEGLSGLSAAINDPVNHQQISLKSMFDPLPILPLAESARFWA